MTKESSYFLCVCCASFLFFATSCNTPTNSSTTKNEDTTAQMITHPDMTKVKTEIQAIANKWADAENARDAKTVSTFYADDAIRLVNGMPMISGKANILKSLEDELTNTPKGSTISIETLEVFGNEKDVIEVGRLTQKDSVGKVFYTGKYLTYWQNRNGKYLAMRDMFNDDAKSK
jgi:ketosteroid isomerase-like protein